MSEITYSTASSVKDAATKLSKTKNNLLIAGGMSLLPTIKLGLNEPSGLIDLISANLSYIKADVNQVTIGSTTRHADVADSKDIAKTIPALSDLAGGIGDPQVRNRGTIGGSIANNDPAADYPAACLGLAATIKTNNREIVADDFFKGLFTTALEPEEIITEVSFAVPKRAAYVKFPNPASRYALVGVFVSEGKDGIRVAVTGASPNGVYREFEFEKVLNSEFSSKSLEGLSANEKNMTNDIHAAADYRAHLVGELTRRAVGNI